MVRGLAGWGCGSLLGKRDTDGLPIEVRSPGNVAELKLSLKTDVLEHYESQTGQRSLDHRMVKQKSATVNLTIEEFTKENLALALYGNYQVGASGTVTARAIMGTASEPKPAPKPLLLTPNSSTAGMATA